LIVLVQVAFLSPWQLVLLVPIPESASSQVMWNWK